MLSLSRFQRPLDSYRVGQLYFTVFSRCAFSHFFVLSQISSALSLLSFDHLLFPLSVLLRALQIRWSLASRAITADQAFSGSGEIVPKCTSRDARREWEARDPTKTERAQRSWKRGNSPFRTIHKESCSQTNLRNAHSAAPPLFVFFFQVSSFEIVSRTLSCRDWWKFNLCLAIDNPSRSYCHTLFK